MKALWFLPFTFVAGAEGFALFAPYLIGVLAVLHFARVSKASAAGLATLRIPATARVDVMPDVQPAL